MGSRQDQTRVIDIGATRYQIETHVSCKQPLQYSITISAGPPQRPLAELQRLCIDGYLANAFVYNEDLLDSFIDVMVSIIKAAPPSIRK